MSRKLRERDPWDTVPSWHFLLVRAHHTFGTIVLTGPGMWTRLDHFQSCVVKSPKKINS